MAFLIKMDRAAGIIALLGFLFTSKPWLQWLNTLSPEGGLLVKNVIVFLSIYILHFFDRVVARPHMNALGILLMYTAFMMIFNYQSEWISDNNFNRVGEQTLDGAAYHRMRSTFGLSPEMSRLVVFVVIPFVLFYAGNALRQRGQRLNL